MVEVWKLNYGGEFCVKVCSVNYSRNALPAVLKSHCVLLW